MRDELERKLTVAQILNIHEVNMLELAQMAHVSPNAVCAMAAGISVDEDLAEQVLEGLSVLIGDKVTLDNVDVRLW